jgi:hypothetical protein
MTKGKKVGLMLLAILFGILIFASLFVAYHHLYLREPSIAYMPLPAVDEGTVVNCPADVVTVLSIDGGGVKGIIPAVLIDKIEQGTQMHGAHLFDFMSGVSTGSILVSLLAMPTSSGAPKYKGSEIIALYQQHAKEVFSSSFLHRVLTLDGLIGPKFQAAGKDRLTREYLGNTTLSELLSHVILFGYDLKSKGLIAFSNDAKQAANMPYYKVRDVVDGTTAIMSFFPSKTLYSQQKKVRHTVADASLVLNNPIAMAFLYAQRQCPNAKHYIVVSMGTGSIPMVDIRPANWGLIRWLPDLVTTTIEGETVTANIFMEKFATFMNANRLPGQLAKVLYLRLNPLVEWQDSNPVDASARHIKKLQQIADDYYKQNQPLFDCLNQLLKNRALDKLSYQCVDLLNQKRQRVTPISYDLEGN